MPPESGSGRRIELTADSLGRRPGEPLGRRVAALRSDRGWTQQDLADRLAVSRVAVSHLEAGMSDPGERTVALLAGAFHMEPHDLVAGTNYPSAKAERLPLVVARYTEVEHQLALLAADLAWLDRLGDGDGVVSAAVREVVDRWQPVLKQLAADTFDPSEQDRVADARRRLGDLL